MLLQNVAMRHHAIRKVDLQPVTASGGIALDDRRGGAAHQNSGPINFCQGEGGRDGMIKGQAFRFVVGIIITFVNNDQF